MLQVAVDWLVYTLLRLSPESRFGQSLNFFIADSAKIIILLFVLIAIIGFLRTFIPQEKMRKWLSGRKTIASNTLASLFGAATPFCSCSSIPIFISFLKAGVPLGAAFSFLVTSPLVNEYLVVLMWGFFGWKITVAYVLCGILIGVIAGMILGRTKLEKYLDKSLFKEKMSTKDVKLTLKNRFLFGINEATSIVKRLWLWILIGVGVAAAIHNYIPQEFIQSIISKGGVLTVPIATVLGVPMYANCVAILPIAAELFAKGIPLGTALAFMMSTAALSLPEAVILRRVMKLKLIMIFFGVVTLGIIVLGYLFNLLQNFLI